MVPERHFVSRCRRLVERKWRLVPRAAVPALAASAAEHDVRTGWAGPHALGAVRATSCRPAAEHDLKAPGQLLASVRAGDEIHIAPRSDHDPNSPFCDCRPTHADKQAQVDAQPRTRLQADPPGKVSWIRHASACWKSRSEWKTGRCSASADTWRRAWPAALRLLPCQRTRSVLSSSDPPAEGRLVSEIALIVTARGVLGVMVGLRQNCRERLRQFESMYVQRYWKLLDQLSLEAVKASPAADAGREDEKAIRNYILLCEDELQMRQNGYISDSTYEVWADGMRDQLSQPMFKKIWTQVDEEAKEHRTFPYEHLRRLLNEPTSDDGDPLTMSPLRRKLRGLAGLGGV